MVSILPAPVRAPLVYQINAQVCEPHVYATDGPDSNILGLAPNYGCCTVNQAQGFPKAASRIFYTSRDGGIAIGMYAPATLTLGKQVVEIATNYPFDSVVTVTVSLGDDEGPSELPLHLRIPGWATSATLTADGVAVPLHGRTGFMQAVVAKDGSTFVLDFNSEMRVEMGGYNGTVSVMWGALLFSLRIGQQFKTLHTYAFQSKDLQVTATTPWNYCIIKSSLKLVRTGNAPGKLPFSPLNLPGEWWLAVVVVLAGLCSLTVLWRDSVH